MSNPLRTRSGLKASPGPRVVLRPSTTCSRSKNDFDAGVCRNGGVMRAGRRNIKRQRSLIERGKRPRRLADYLAHIFSLIHPRRVFSYIHDHPVSSVVALILITLTTVGVFKLHKAYAHYAAIVDTQLKQQALRRKGGLYAAPRRVSVEQRISRDELIERFLRAG